jgi:hypothetical protein
MAARVGRVRSDGHTVNVASITGRRTELAGTLRDLANTPLRRLARASPSTTIQAKID